MTSLLTAPPFNDLADWISQGGNPATERNLGGVVGAYPIFMFTGIILVIIASLIKLKNRNIPLVEFEWAVLIVVPVGILGGTIFGKIFIPNMVWYHVFFFWEPGMSLFGALGFGTVAGFAWFYTRSKSTKISVWVYADCILPNVLLGQAIGRWGNFYNHEILGQVVDYDTLSWLIPSIRDKLWYFPSELAAIPLQNGWWNLIFEASGTLKSASSLASDLSLTSEQGQMLWEALTQPIQFRQPLFLIESLCNLGLWFLLTFFVANLSRFFQKKGKYPWDLNPKAFPGWYNHQYKSLPEKEITLWSTQNPIKYKKVLIKKGQGVETELKIPFFQAWNKAYYLSEIDDQSRNELFKLIDEHERKVDINETNLEKAIQLHKNHVFKIKQDYQKKLRLVGNNKTKRQEILTLKKAELKTERDQYLTKSKTYKKNLGGFGYQYKPNPLAKQIEHAFNPNQYFILRCGVVSGGYVFGYTFYRTILETLRQPQEYFVQNYAIPNFIVLSLIVCFGLFLIVWAQFYAPYKYRDVGWLYEKSY